MDRFIVFLVSFTFVSSCGNKAHNDSLKVVDEVSTNNISNEDSLRSIISTLEKKMESSMIAQDSMQFVEAWDQLDEMDTALISFYVNCWKSDKWNDDWSIILGNTAELDIGGGILSIDPNPKMSSLYLISALYYEDYFFATIPLLYDTSEVVYNDSTDEYLFQNVINSTVIGRKHLDRCWSFTVNWLEKNKNKNMNELRNQGRPLPSDIFWLGEPEGSINGESYLSE